MLASLSILGILAMAGPAPDAPETRPNVVLVVADDLGFAELGCYGQTKIRTPSIDALAAGGMRLLQFYSGSPVCAPSRCTLMTGKHTGHAHVRNNREIRPLGQEPIPDATVTMAELLKARGYATAAIGKWGLGFPGSEGDPNRQGFDLFFGYNCQRHAHNHYPTYLLRNDDRIELEGNDGGATGRQFSHDLMEAEALRFVDNHADEPFFLYLPFTIPHLAIQVPEDSLAEYQGLWDDPPYTGGKGYLPHPSPRAAYAAMITRMDRTVGRLMDRLREKGLSDRTIVIFTSDNGPTYDRLGGSDSDFFESAANLRGRKGSVYEGGIRVPLIVAWPGRIEPGTSTDLAAYFPDLLPTILDLVGESTAIPADVDGLSLAPSLLGDFASQRHHEFMYWEFPAYGGQQAARYGPWKGVRQNLSKGQTQIELYNLETDPAESRDVSSDHPDILARIKQILNDAHTPSDLFPLPTIDAKE